MNAQSSAEIKPIIHGDKGLVNEPALSKQLLSRLVDSAFDQTVEDAASFEKCQTDASDHGAIISQVERVSDDELPNESDPSDRAQETAAPVGKTGAASLTNGSSNVGRWSDEEHRRFLVAFRQHPRKWSRIAACVGTRTKVQVRTHALKYHQKLARERENEESGVSAAEKNTNFRPLSSEQLLSQLVDSAVDQTVDDVASFGECQANVSDHGAIILQNGRVSDDELPNESDPSDLAQETAAPGETGAVSLTNGSSNIGCWSDEEHRRFLVAFRQHPRRWSKIAACVGTRNKVQVRTHALGCGKGLAREAREDEERGSSAAGGNTNFIPSSIGRVGKNEEGGSGGESRALEQNAGTAGGGATIFAQNQGREKQANAAGCSGRTGRWTPEEHSLFLRAIQEHGKDWRGIAAVVKTRSALQVRTHAQKWYKKPRQVRLMMIEAAHAWHAGKHMDANSPGTTAGNKPAAVRDGIGSAATATPASVATVPPGRSSDVRCRKRRQMDRKVGAPGASGVPSSVKEGQANNADDTRSGHWLPEEHRLFLAAVEEYGRDWHRIAAVVKTRSAVQAYTHAQKYYQKLGKAKPGRNEVRQSKSEESVASKANHTADSSGKYPAVTAPLPASTAKDENSKRRREQCHQVHAAIAVAGCPTPPVEPCQHHREPPKNDDRAAGRWTQEEHSLFLVAALRHGRDWEKIAAFVATRSAAQVRAYAREWYLRRLLRQRQMEARTGRRRNAFC